MAALQGAYHTVDTLHNPGIAHGCWCRPAGMGFRKWCRGRGQFRDTVVAFERPLCAVVVVSSLLWNVES